jgi:hypothetical protein
MPETIAQAFSEFYQNILLTPNQQEEVDTRFRGVMNALHKYFYGETDNNDRFKLIGSHGKETDIRPPSDIDTVFLLPPSEWERYSSFSSNGQAALLQKIREVLMKTYSETDVKAWEKVVKVDFNGHKVEVVPAWRLPDGKFRIPNSTNGGIWEEIDYDSEIKQLNHFNERNHGKTKQIIRMIKKWNRTISPVVPLSSYDIEKFVINFVSVYNPANKSCSLIIKDFFNYLSIAVEKSQRSYVLTAKDRASRACFYQAEGELEKATDEWRKIFGDDFPKVYKTGTKEKLEDAPMGHEEFLYQDIDVDINPQYRVEIDCIKNDYNCGGSPVSAVVGDKLEFHAKILNVPGPYTMKWKVRNFGEDAIMAGDLRGKIELSTPKDTIKQENAKYRGTHFVECFVIKNQCCVTSAILTVSIG